MPTFLSFLITFLGFTVKTSRTKSSKANPITIKKKKAILAPESQLVPNQMDAKQFYQKNGNVHGYNPNKNTMSKFRLS